MLYARLGAVRVFFTLLAPGVIVFPGLFVAASPVTPLLVHHGRVPEQAVPHSTLHYLHLMLPHQPFEYLPSERRYRARRRICISTSGVIRDVVRTIGRRTGDRLVDNGS